MYLKCMEKFSCIIIDDDEIDRLTVVSYAKKFPELHIAGVFESAAEARKQTDLQNTDILFLDIDMPGDSGLDLRKTLLHIPVCVFITAHAEHAVESFELQALDFMIKPLRYDRFEKTMTRINEFMAVKHKAALFESGVGADTIFIKEGHEQVKITLHDVLYLEALKDYTLIVTAHKRHCVLSGIGTLLKETHFKSFVRVHRSFAVHKPFIKKIGTQDIELSNQVLIPVGRSYKDNIHLLL